MEDFLKLLSAAVESIDYSYCERYLEAKLRTGGNDYDNFIAMYWELETNRGDIEITRKYAKYLHNNFPDNYTAKKASLRMIERIGDYKLLRTLSKKVKHFPLSHAWATFAMRKYTSTRIILRIHLTQSHGDLKAIDRCKNYLLTMPNRELAEELKTLKSTEYSVNEKYDLLPYAMVLHLHHGSEDLIVDKCIASIGDDNCSQRLKQWALLALALRLRYRGKIHDVENFLSMANKSNLLCTMHDTCIESLRKQSRQSKTLLRSEKTGRGEEKRLAILLSGYPRSYETGFEIYKIKKKNPNWKIDVFCYSFERLGDLYAPKGSPAELVDYSHGGYQREIEKTLIIDHEKLKQSLGDCVLEIHNRPTDEWLQENIGIKHPQWYGVYESWKMLERHSRKYGIKYHAVLRSRFDHAFGDLTLPLHDLISKEIFVPGNLWFGYDGYRINDREALGSPEAMKIYCGLGKEKSFVNLHSDLDWKAKMSKEAAGSHESHLAFWLYKQGICVSRLPNYYSRMN